ncbi:uncharacterized protein STEHIDRAFT_127186 [Stereum hirsutum FP-91666 SS1]|uniref:uncharacterized protein n=1 Tax=Stereum hirsutum (strain FP-91666) TaxID=721885 RepID=UPI000440AB0E|nr:uncharacterized protein STEHIDRAFT_127186 [Stereum hirsutum FP-91666 SS1]EIM92354.1 hypothetical protein STEHIDRAFT_127186 [Stereum hirsutum FP-91666 SS1]
MSGEQRPTVRMNNYFQGRGEMERLGYFEQDHGSWAPYRWTIAYTVDGTTMGKASAARKEDAKNEAARQLCQNMGI